MRLALAAALAALASACGVTPGEPPQMGANEMQQRPGVFSGGSGDFLLFGTRPAPAAQPAPLQAAPRQPPQP
jgi:hypothetical protein